jgi:hypothetical protein
VGVSCPSGQHCCTNSSTYATMCGADCPAGTLIVDCTAPSDCKDSAAPVCCGLHLLAAAQAAFSDAGSAEAGAGVPASGGVQCVATCPSDSVVFCATGADCPAGESCNAVQQGVMQCGAPMDGG